MTAVTVIIILVVGGISIAAAVYTISNGNKLFNSGAALKSRQYDFYQQLHEFKTIVPSLDQMLDAMDKSAFGQAGVGVHKSGNRVVFQGSSFVASIKLDGDSKIDGVHLYKFSVNNWKEYRGSIETSARIGANVALTAVERAFATLDYNAVVERTYMTDIKTKSSFF